MRRAPLLVVGAVALALTPACGGGGTDTVRVTVDDAGRVPSVVTTTTAPALSSQLGERASAIPSPPSPSHPQPVRLEIPSIGLRDATVRPVGVEADGAMEIPPAREVGWYRFGSAPGEPGSAVLAAHIAYDGRNGAFRHLVDIEIGAGVVVALEDGSTRSFVVTGIRQFHKTELPKDLLFARDGPARIVLITCGGDFLPAARSYQDNIVVFAEPG